MKNKNVEQVPVAIIGIGCIFAKSSDLKSFLHTLKRGVNGISAPPATHQYLADYFDPDPKKPDHIYCNRGGYLPNVDFDPTEFSIPPNALEATDTSQLLGLVTAKKALADAGYGTEGKEFDRTKASVILGVTGTQELVIPLGARLGHPIWQQALADAGVEEQKAAEVIQRISDGYVGWQENSFPGLLGNVVAGRIANRLDLGGTNCVVDAACASSMGAVHMALLELTSGRSDLVITGGVDTINDAFMHMCFSKTQILSASGDVRPFSKDADGTVLGEGVGLVVLKRLEEAECDGDRVYAVIKGIGSASDGKSQSIYAPKPEGQARALKRAYEAAGIDPKSVDMVEAHGTGTRVGDQVEFKALCDVFGAQSPNGNRCALGSVKSNIGHTKAAAGTAGLIKTALSIYHKVLPPTLKADEADPKLGLTHSPFYLNTRLRPWVGRKGQKRRAGVSAFGFGGSNFHTVLEEHKSDKVEPSWDGAIEIAAFSGSSKKEVKQKIALWTGEIQKQPTIHHIGKLAKQSRYQFDMHASHRLVMALDLMQPMEILQSIWQHALEGLNGSQRINHDAVFYGEGRKPGKLAFLMPGQGSQYVGMGRDLNCCFPQSLAAFQDAAASFKADQKLEDYIYPRMDSASPSHEANLRQTQVAQPAIGAVTASMLTAMKLFNVDPDATCGHSYGELTALHAAGWISQQDLWALSNERGRLMADAGKAAGEAGTMLAVRAPLEEIEALLTTLDSPVVLANRNSHQQGVLSGPLKAIELAESACKSKDWKNIRLPVAAAFHSHLVAQAQKPFADRVASVKIMTNDTMVMSNTNGGVYPRDDERVAALLGGQLAQPVDFVSNIETLYAEGFRTFVEVGPKNVLTNLVRQTLKGKDALAVALDQSCGRYSGLMDLARTLSCLAAQGHGVALKRWEKAAAPHRKARMAISLSGANYRNPQSENNYTASRSVAATKKPAPLPRRNGPEPKRASKESNNLPNKAVDTARTQIAAPDHRAHKSVDPTVQKSLQSAMSTVQQGLASLQALQSQTTLAHQKYLDTQAEASRTLQHLIQSTQQLSQTTLNSDALALPESLLRQPTPSTPARKVQEPVVKPVSATQEPRTPHPEAPHPGRPKDNLQLRQSLVAIVSELTGYPEDMLDLGMDIEADLGIDSIKRVEILSALEEKLPDLPKVTPDMMGTLKTLGQICDYLAENSSSSPAPEQAPQPDASQTASVNPGGLQQSLVTIVSELTGYPEDMLDLGMDIEADLGIDSIKRVEILSALEEKLPDLPKVTPDMMGTLKTLGQICDYLAENSSSSPAPEQAPQPDASQTASVNPGGLQQSLVTIVSELTGYPEDMLDLGMDIEADLGIDSIKRVEILSALEEKLPDLPKVTPDMMGTLKTLGQICDYLAENSSSSPAPEQAPQPDASQTASVNPGGLQQSLVTIVSELTGYPEDMLDLGMDIEADLGIDSIKRVEILSALEEKLPDLPKVTPDMMGTLKTLGQICDYLNTPVSPVSETPCKRECEAPSANKTPAAEVVVDRHIVKTVSLPLDQVGQPQWSAESIFGLVGGPKRMGDAIVRAFKAQGLKAKVLSNPETLSSLDNLCALLLIAPLHAQEAFQWVQSAAPSLQQAAKQGAAGLFTLSFLDGAFGFSNRGIETPDQGALAGLSKTAGLEWPDLNCLALDINPDWRDEDAVSQAVVNEVLYVTPQTPSEIGLNPDGRIGLQLTSAKLATSSEKLNLSSQDVVVVTGGARGVTAAAAMALSDHTPCILAVMGRSPEPQPEPQWLSDLHAPGDMKKAIVANLFDNRRPTPAQVEAIYKQYAANREIQANLDRLKQKGVSVRYYSVDVRNPAAVKASLDFIRNNLGPIKGLVHGAGVLADRRIGDKDLAQFQNVYDTKVQGLQTLLEGTQEDRLSYIVLFSSVSARMGNYGQVDYAMANEVLNKVAQQQAQLRTDCKVIAINWGPWDGGMVTPGLKQNFTNRGVGLIPLELGAMAMVDEMGQPGSGPVEVIIGSSLHHDSQSAESVSTVPLPAPEHMTLICKREIDLNNYLVLNSHQIDGRPVVPLALITEWLAHSALHANPGLTLHGIDHLRLFNGIAMDRQKRSVQMLAGKTERKGELFEVDVEIRNGFKEDVKKVHSRAKAILTENLPAAPKFIENGHFKSQPAKHSLDEIYESVLFHGDDLRGILEIIAISDHGMSARIASAPLPAKWISEPLRSRWIADPLVLDSAFQMAIVWCYEQSGRVSLPSYAKAYRQYCQRFPSDGVSAVMEIHKFTEHKLVSDFTFLDQQKRVVASLNGYEAVMAPNLMKAFKAA